MVFRAAPGRGHAIAHAAIPLSEAETKDHLGASDYVVKVCVEKLAKLELPSDSDCSIGSAYDVISACLLLIKSTRYDTPNPSRYTLCRSPLVVA